MFPRKARKRGYHQVCGLGTLLECINELKTELRVKAERQ